jgi:branched-chain amino acid transport system permease protein
VVTAADARARPGPPDVPALPTAIVAAGLLAAAVAAVVGPFPVTAGVARLAGWVLLTAGAAVLVARTGTVDLSTAATTAVGAYVGAVAVPLAGAPAPLGLAAGAIAGLVAGGLTGALAGRVGGRLAALPTLSVGLATVAVIRAWPGSGGAAGYHAAPFLTGGETTDAVAAVVLAAGGLAAVTTWWPARAAAQASVGARAPAALAAHGHHPARATAAAGALGGALLGAGGATQAMVSGSVTPAAFGLGLAAALALAATLGGTPPLGPVVGALWLWGPSVVFPLAPVVGDAPPLLTTGVLGVAVLALRRGRPLLAGPPRTRVDVPGRPAAMSSEVLASPEAAGPSTAGGPDPDARPVLEVPATAGHEALAVRPGEVVAVVGPNGAGKSTLLARIGGQLRDHAGTTLRGRPAPRGAVARARAGLARAWQRPPDTPTRDLVAAAVPPGPVDAAAAGRALADRVAGCLPDATRHTPAGAQLVAAARTGPTVVLLDEPATTLPEDVVVDVVKTLARAGVAVVLVDHRPDVLAVAHRRCAVASTSTAPPRGGTP